MNARRKEIDDGSIEIGHEFGGLTLKEKNGCDWILQCACKNVITVKRSEMLKNKRISCGVRCKKRSALRRKKKKENEIADTAVHMEIPGFKWVETRTNSNGVKWMIFRRAA